MCTGTRVLHMYSTYKQIEIYVQVDKVNVYNYYFRIKQIEWKDAKKITCVWTSRSAKIYRVYKINCIYLFQVWTDSKYTRLFDV